jgi:hypothetical protein
MTPTEYRAAIAALGLSQVKAAKLFDADPRTSRRWAAGDLDIPRAVEIALNLMVRFKVKPEKLLKESEANG